MARDWRAAVPPQGWESRPILELVELPKGQVDPKKVPYRSMVLVAPDHIESATGCLLSKETAAEQNAISGKYLFQPDDIVYSKIRPYLRKVIRADFEGLCSADMYPLRCREGLAPRFLLGLLLSEHFSRFAEIVSMRSGFPKINREEFAEYIASVPPLPEQQKIAEILDTVDAAIRKTEQLIAKLEQVKQGLLHDLLTRGIDDNGELRDPERHPEQFKESVLGRIPQEWEVGPFSEYASDRPYLKTGPFGSSLKQEHWVPDGVPVITIGSLGEGEFIESELLYISEKTAASLAAYALLPGDIVFSRVADVGRSVVVTEAQHGWIMSSNMMWISVDQDRSTPVYVQANIAANWAVRGQIRKLVNSAGRDVANAGIMNSLQLPWPRKAEQEQVATMLSVHDSRICAEKSKIRKLQLLKHGLIDDLLTGRVRVTHLLEKPPK